MNRQIQWDLWIQCNCAAGKITCTRVWDLGPLLHSGGWSDFQFCSLHSKLYPVLRYLHLVDHAVDCFYVNSKISPPRGDTTLGFWKFLLLEFFVLFFFFLRQRQFLLSLNLDVRTQKTLFFWKAVKTHVIAPEIELLTQLRTQSNNGYDQMMVIVFLITWE